MQNVLLLLFQLTVKIHSICKGSSFYFPYLESELEDLNCTVTLQM